MLTFLLVIIYLAFISLGLPDSLLGSAWPVISEDLKVPLSAAGVISMIITGGTIVSSLVGSRLIRRFGTGVVTLISVLMTAAALAGYSAAGSAAGLCLLAVPLGLGAGAVDAGLNNFVALHYKAQHMNWLHCFWGIGATGGPVLMSLFLGREQGWRGGYSAIAVIQGALTLILLLTLPLWRKVERTPDRRGEEAAAEKTNLLAIPGVKTILVSFFCYCGLELTAGLWGSSYLVSARGVPPETAAKWISLFYLGITAGRLAAGFLSMALDTRRIIRLGQALIACGGVLFVFPLPSAACAAGFALIGLGCAPIYPGMLHETPKRVGRENSQAMMGISMACAYVGSTVMPPAFGFLAGAFGTELLPGYLLTVLIVMVLCIERTNALMKRGVGGRSLTPQ